METVMRQKVGDCTIYLCCFFSGIKHCELLDLNHKAICSFKTLL